MSTLFWIITAVLVILLWPIVMLIGMIAWIALLWLIGMPITIKKDKREIGYVRWFKFYQTHY